MSETNRPTVMLVDDEPDILGFVETALRDEGYGVVATTNAPEALRSVRAESPDLILLDARMPRMDGAAFLSALRANHEEHVPVVLMTASRLGDAEVRRLGAQDFLAKPFDLDELLSCVARFLQRTP
jgi:DNA-binding response OmpR family regulator